MKKLLLILWLVLPALTNAQTYSEVIQVEDKSVDELYSSAREWFAITFKSANDVLQMDDPVAGKLIGKGNTPIRDFYTTGGIASIPVNVVFDLSYTINIAVREGRYKYELSDITVFNGTISSSFSVYKDKLQYFKDSSTSEGAKTQIAETGMRPSKNAIKIFMLVNQKTVECISKADNEIAAIIESMKLAMAKTDDDNW